MDTSTHGRALRRPGRPSWVLVVRESVSRHEREVLGGRMKATTSADVARLLHPRLARELVEVLVVLCLDGQNNVTHLAEVSRGGLHGCSVSARDLFRVAVAAGASAIIVAHNHPSGDPTPSPEDITMTARLVDVGEVLGIPLVDHLVIAGGRHSSMLDLGIIR